MDALAADITHEDLYVYRATIVSVYDGDTIRLNIDLGFGTWIINTPVRMIGIDAPELRGIERPQGLASRDHLAAVLPQKTEVLIKTEKDKSDKYGRYLASVFLLDGSNVNLQMIADGFAEFYNP